MADAPVEPRTAQEIVEEHTALAAATQAPAQREPGWYAVKDSQGVWEPAHFKPYGAAPTHEWWYRCGFYKDDETLGCEIGQRLHMPAAAPQAEEADAKRLAEPGHRLRAHLLLDAAPKDRSYADGIWLEERIAAEIAEAERRGAERMRAADVRALENYTWGRNSKRTAGEFADYLAALPLPSEGEGSK